MTDSSNNERLSIKRVFYICLIFLVAIASSLLLGLSEGLLLDEIMCLFLIHLVFFTIFIIALQNMRMHNHGIYRSTSYRKLLYIVILCFAIIDVFHFLPNLMAPIMVIAIFLGIILEDSIALAFSLYIIIVYSLTCGLGMYELYAYILMAIIGQLFISYRKRNRNDKLTVSYLILSFVFAFFIPLIFYYFTYYSINIENIVSCLINAVITFCVSLFLLDPLIRWVEDENIACYEDILDEDYPLVLDIKHFSTAEYIHAMRVSKLSRICAMEANCKELTCACAGFYYRLGKVLGEPEIDNAVKVTTNRCFPMDVVDILSEYGGIIRKPSTPESSIIHIVDQIVTKIELLDRDTMSVSWNQDMVIYQSMNELSSSGMYDESGLSMNQFLKIRERLVQEEILK